MAAGDRIPLVAVSATHDDVAIAGMTHAVLEIQPTVADEPPAAGALGEGGQALTMTRVLVTVFGNSINALVALLGAAAADLAIVYKAADGSNYTCTVAAVAFTRFGAGLAFPPIDGGGRVGPFAVSGRAEWAEGDALSDVLSFA